MTVPSLFEKLALADPDLGERLLHHDREFGEIDRVFDTIRDVVNKGIDVLNELGCGLRRLPEESLEELVVLPLTGDYRRIRQNAEAVVQVERALRAYARNALRLAAATDPRWGGDAASAYLLRVGRQAAVAGASAEVVALAVPALEVVAEVSERTAVEVEELVVELVERGRRLVRRLLARAAGPVGWGVFAAEVALEGLDAFTDLVDDARRLVAIIDRLLAMKDELGSWVEEQRERLALLEDVAVAARAGLPVVG